MMKKIFLRGFEGTTLGVAIGLIISVLINYLLGNSEYYPAPPRFVIQFENQLQALMASMLIWAAIGAMFSCTNLVFTEVDWSITKMTIVHFLITYIFFLPLSIVAGWYPISIVEIGVFTVYFIVIYIVIWILSMVKASREIKKINANL